MAYAGDFGTLVGLRMALGFFHAFFAPAQYSLIVDFFPKKMRSRAFSLYSVLIQLADTVSALTTHMISAVGWRGAFRICGGYGAGVAGLAFIIMREPQGERAEEDPEEEDVSFKASRGRSSNRNYADMQSHKAPALQIKNCSYASFPSTTSLK